MSNSNPEPATPEKQNFAASLPSRELWLLWVKTLSLGTLGGGLFYLLDIPLPWMLGAISANLLFALRGHNLAVGQRWRQLNLALLGCMLGTAFTPDMLGYIHQWAGSVIALFICVVLSIIAAVIFLRRVGGLGPVSAYFAAAPGGLSEMVSIGAAMGGDERKISLIHSLRILIAVFTIPFIFEIFGHDDLTRSAGSAIQWPSLQEALLLLAACWAGVLLARQLKFPAAFMIGGLMGSAAFHLTGLSAAQVPPPIVAIAQVSLGSAIGSRFTGFSGKTVLKTAITSFFSTNIIIGCAALCAFVAAPITGIAFAPLLLAFAPGGVAEMSLIAISLGVDVAFVSTHHVVRIAMIVALAPVVFRLCRHILKWYEEHPPEDAPK